MNGLRSPSSRTSDNCWPDWGYAVTTYRPWYGGWTTYLAPAVPYTAYQPVAYVPAARLLWHLWFVRWRWPVRWLRSLLRDSIIIRRLMLDV